MNEFRLETRRFLSNRAGKEVLEQHSSNRTEGGNLMRFRVELSKFRKGHLFCTRLLFKRIEPDKQRGPFFILFPVLPLLPYQSCSLSHRSQVNPEESFSVMSFSALILWLFNGVFLLCQGIKQIKKGKPTQCMEKVCKHAVV